jgi:hypothetical protein
MVTTEELLAELTEIRQRVAECESVLAIQNLKARYGDLVDRRFSKGAVVADPILSTVAEQIAGLFTSDGVWDGGPRLGRARGRRAIAARLREPTLEFSRHLFLNPRITVRGKQATARWDLLVPCRGADGSSYWMSGYEDDEYIMVDGMWLHRSMRMTTVFMTPVGEGWSEIFV